MEEDKIKVLEEWISYVRADETKFRRAAKNLSSREGILFLRNQMASLGKECTPSEIEEFGKLIKETIHVIDMMDGEDA
ncbi:MAG: hypothetical protein ACO3UU_12725 [Minisyncoccia bacterium]